MKAVKKFRGLIDKKRPSAMSGTLGKGIRTFHPSSSIDGYAEPPLQKSRSTDLHDRRNVEAALAAEGVHYDVNPVDSNSLGPIGSRVDSSVTMIDAPKDSPEDQITPSPKGERISSDHLSQSSSPALLHHESSGEKGHAHDPLDEEPLFLGIGLGGPDLLEAPPQDVVAESPTAAEFSIYDTAYQEEVDRIREAQGHRATVYLTRRVDSKKKYKADENMVDAPKASEIEGMPHQGFKGLLDRAREKDTYLSSGDRKAATGGTFSDIAGKAMENTKKVGMGLSDKGGVALGNVLQMATEKRKEMSEIKDSKES
jgi:[calcium/calmodulin-dependent protein kinase] kinase